MDKRLTWERDGIDWPLREASRFVQAGGLRWHVQDLGAGPVALLVHGTGSSTHSWRDVAPLLAENFRVVAIDLPGHAFTEMPAPSRQSLPGMAAELGVLLATLRLDPAVAVGHSAGAAIVLQMSLEGAISPRVVVSLNGALLPLGGLAGLLFPPVARLIGSSALIPRLFARRADDPAAVARLIAGTGSTLDERGVALYQRLVRSPQHGAAALAMMAHWDLRPLARELPRLETALNLVAAMNDRTVPPRQAVQVLQGFAPGAAVRLTRLPGLGHLAHEEEPRAAAWLIHSSYRRAVRASNAFSAASPGRCAPFNAAAASPR